MTCQLQKKNVLLVVAYLCAPDPEPDQLGGFGCPASVEGGDPGQHKDQGAGTGKKVHRLPPLPELQPHAASWGHKGLKPPLKHGGPEFNGLLLDTVCAGRVPFEVGVRGLGDGPQRSEFHELALQILVRDFLRP